MQVDSAAVPRPAKKPKTGELHRLHVILPAETVALIDRAAEDMPRDARSLRQPTRTEAIRIFIFEGLKKRGLVK